mmetsp:Transcript_25669/g.66011  ORF Transcript_25669/g.66011 Transcript_25669/m.66011 type:complete len:264 (-) Transcript_25669:742-1533(-)
MWWSECLHRSQSLLSRSHLAISRSRPEAPKHAISAVAPSSERAVMLAFRSSNSLAASRLPPARATCSMGLPNLKSSSPAGQQSKREASVLPSSSPSRACLPIVIVSISLRTSTTPRRRCGSFFVPTKLIGRFSPSSSGRSRSKRSCASVRCNSSRVKRLFRAEIRHISRTFRSRCVSAVGLISSSLQFRKKASSRSSSQYRKSNDVCGQSTWALSRSKVCTVRNAHTLTATRNGVISSLFLRLMSALAAIARFTTSLPARRQA